MSKKAKEAETARGRPRRTTAGCPKGVVEDKQALHGRAAQANKPRLRTANRQQLLSPKTIDQLLESDHPARSVWRYVEDLDLSLLYDRIGSREGFSGRPAIDPRVLVALWLYAFLAGIVSARLLARLCRRHDAFRWLAGGLVINYHTLADLRVDQVDFLEQLFQHSVEVLRQQGLVDLDRVAQDGIRIRLGWCCLVSPSPDLGACAARSQGQPRWLGAATGRHWRCQFPGNRQAAGRTAWVPPGGPQRNQ